MTLQAVAVLKGAFQTQVESLFNRHPRFRLEHNPRRNGCDFLVLTGGEDVNPSLYGEAAIQGTSCTPSRDSFEISMFEFFKDTPKIGICRGAQILNVLSGGSMWQNTNGHQGSHPSFVPKSQTTLFTSSIHHQMMRPGPGGEVLMIADESEFVENQQGRVLKREKPYDDIEVVWYPDTKSFCYQGHPELGNREEVAWFFDQIEEKFGV